LLVFGFLGAPLATAQVVLPEGVFVYHWDRGAGTNNWADAANWYNSTGFFNDQVPVPPADVVFGSKPSGTGPQTVVLNTANTAVRSIWFEAGRDYTLQGTGSFILGGGLADNGRLVTVLEGGLPENRYTINQSISLTPVDGSNPAKTYEIANYATDSLLSFLGNVNLGGNSLRFTGTGATYFGAIFTANNSTLSTVASSSTAYTTLILGATQASSLTIGANTLAIQRAVVSQSQNPHDTFAINNISVQSGGTLDLRAAITGPTRPSITVSGAGLIRQARAAPVGAIYGSAQIDGDNDTHAITLVGDTSFGARSGRSDGLLINRRITESSGNRSFTKVGSGLVSLSSWGGGMGNSWTGVTNLNGGVLRRTVFNGLPAANLRFNGGLLELDFTGLNRPLGSGANEIQWLGDGGFSAFRAARIASLGNAALTWGAGSFVPTGSKLLLSSRYASDQITFTNAINLGSELREVRVERGIRAVAQGTLTETERALGRMSGTLSGTGGGILKTGPGLLWLDNAANSYTGATLIREGSLRGNIPANSNIELEGGVLGLDGNFTRNRFGNGGRIIWQGSGGFAAYGANRTVRIDNQTTSEIGWGWNNFVQTGQELRFGHYTADAAVIWDRALNFGNAMRTIRVERGQALGMSPNLVDVVFNRTLNNSAKSGGLRLVGDGRADLAADSVNLDSDVLEISGAELRIATSNVRLGPVGNIALSEGGRFTIGNFGFGSYDSGQVADTTKVTLNTGTLRYEGRTTENLPNTFWNFPSVETIGDVALETGANEIQIIHNIPGYGYTELQVRTLQRAAASRATLNVSGGTLSAINSLLEHVVGGIIPWAVWGGSTNAAAWVSVDASSPNTLSFIQGNYNSGANYSGNYRTTSAVSLPADTTLNSLFLAYSIPQGSMAPPIPGVATLNGTLTLSSGGLISAGVALPSNISNTITGTGTLTTSASRPLYTHVYGSGLQFNGSVRVIGNRDWVKTGPSVLRYNSTGTSQIGSLYIHQGTMEFNNGSIQTGATGEVFIGDGAGRDTLVINGGTDRLANRPKVTLRGTPYGRGAEFGAAEDQATLAIANGATQTLRELHIIDRGTLDFSGGKPDVPNRLFLDALTFNNAGAQLFVRGWHEYEDFLLIKKTAAAVGQWPELLKQIFFDGYSLDYDLLVKNYNNDYWEITPWGRMDASAMPEPTTYGAIIGAIGIGLWTWRRKRRVASATHVADKTKHAE